MSDPKIEHSGFWWNPAKPDEKWAGTLRITRKGRSTLALILPQPSLASFFVAIRDGVREIDVLHGETADGKPVSVLKCFEQHHGQFFVNATIVGFHAETSDPLIGRAVMVPNNLDVWWGPTAVELHERHKWPDAATVRYVKPEPLVVFEDDECVIKISSTAGVQPGGDMSYTVAEEIRVEFDAKVPCRLSQASKRIFACRDLLSVACLSLCNVKAFRIEPPLDAAERRRFRTPTYHASPIFRERKSERATSWPDLLFRRSDVADERLKDVFTTWLAHADSLRVVRSLYHAGSYGKGFLEFRVLSLAQAAEAYHQRAYSHRTYVTKQDYRKDVLEPIRRALPQDLDDRLRVSIESALAFGNQMNFRERLEDLFTEHQAALGAIVPTPSDWIGKIKDYRNAFTHHPADRDTVPFDHEDVIRCLYILKMLLEMCFLREMGFGADEIAELAERNHRYRQVKARFFQDRQQAVKTAD